MSNNPLLNAVGATAYITLVVTLMQFITQTYGNKPDPVYAPVIFLSTLVFSVAVMGYLFFYQPLVLLVDGKKKEALRLFLQTIGIFGVITVVASVVIFSL